MKRLLFAIGFMLVALAVEPRLGEAGTAGSKFS